jgi:hypothetical protein
MGSLSDDKAGVGSAVNDTTREIGGTLGVAVVGSVFASVFGPQLRDALSLSGVPSATAEQASSSLSAAMAVAAQAPPEVSQVLMSSATDAFVSGLSAGCWVAVAAVVIGALVTAAFLPARHGNRAA